MVKALLFFIVYITLTLISTNAKAETPLADSPIFATNVPANVALALSVEFPTGVTSAYRDGYDGTYRDEYDDKKEFLGYFDADKCYKYVLGSSTANPSDGNYFQPVAKATNHTCNLVTNGRWSGNFLNWALTQTVDTFRSAMTGGYRNIDRIGMTILEKAWFPPPTYSPTAPSIVNNRTLITNATPFSNLTNIFINFQCSGNQFYFSGTDASVTNKLPSGYNCAPVINAPLVEDVNIPATINTTNVYRMFARVRVCDSTTSMAAAGLETNCSAYGSHFKPEGLIQKHAKKLNFAAIGYLNDDNRLRDGGVLRARMAPVGPIYTVNGSNLSNPNPEWDASTGIYFDNPIAKDALDSGGSALGINSSGVMNYLNKFGVASKKYKFHDPVAELFYTTQRYFKNQGIVQAYTDNANKEMLDGFPAIKNWDDPIKYTCQKNFILGIGDTISNPDGNLPGSVVRNIEPALPTEVSNDKTVDVRLATNTVGQLEGINKYGNLGERYIPWCCNGTYSIAGLAYDVHTTDIRPTMPGNQSITTYWFDVLEEGEKKNVGGDGMRNQFWLAAKYGGFDVPENYVPYGNTLSPLSKNQWDLDGDDYPDNYFMANNPSLMIKGLNKAFENILSKAAGSKSGYILTTPDIINNNTVFSASYDAEKWTGNIIARSINFNNAGVASYAELWQAVNTLETQASGQGWAGGRFIASANCLATTDGMQSCKGTPFRFADLSASHQASLSKVGSTLVNSSNLLNYLRGDRTNEGVLRLRSKLLGDIVNSQIRAVGAPNAQYNEVTNPGYTDFRNANSSRASVAYVGANDGMLHAFHATTGKELFAYVPSALFKGPTNKPEEDGLAALANNSFTHHAYVDSTPVVVDVNFGAGDWRSLLIGGLGKGGKSYYAVDVTNPAAITSELELSNKVVWEFTHKDLGFSYGRPVIVKAGGKWIVILTSGYNNADGKGYFFILDAATGKLIKQISTGEPYTSDAGLAHASAFIADSRDYSADAAYAGDLHGNIWRLDLTGAASDAYPSPVKIAKLTSNKGANQPITVSPMIEVDQNTFKRYVFVGTGRLLAESDINDNSEQSFYAISDGTDKAFFNLSTLPKTAGGFPISRDDMVNHTNQTGAVVTDDKKEMGYFIDLDSGYRINTPMDTSAGMIAFAANNVSGDVCNVAAKFRGYGFSYGSGKSLLVQTGSTSAKQYYEGSGMVSGVVIYKKPNNNNLSVNFSSNGDEGNKSIDTESATPTFQYLNWRSIPNND